jgi:hypothetical protein
MDEPAQRDPRAPAWAWGIALTALATGLRLGWVLAVPTVPVSDFAMYRESANYLSEFGALDHGFIYMPGFVVLLAWIKDAGGDLLAQKMPGVFFGGLGAAGLFGLTRALLPAQPRWWLPSPAAIVATAIYALWPAGLAMASVVGTDVPAAALIVSALAVLAALGPRRPWTAAVAFGAIMGLGAWMRAVALPLTALSAGYWVATRTPLRRAAALTAVAVAATLAVLAPWAARHVRQTGELYFTDDHGGITALIGANPNSEGTYTRALNQMFHDLTGQSVLDEPHRQVDRAAYALAREWTRFEPAYALGLAVMKGERLFDPEQRLLYWSVFRPGVLAGPRGAWFAARRAAIGEAVDAFGTLVAALALGGVAIAAARRRWALLALVPFQLALVATYTVFFAEPRYRLPIEMLALPFVALAVVELGGAARALATRDLRRAGAAAPGLAAAGVLVLAWQLGWPALIEEGARLRARHRWAATVWRVDGRPRLCKWRPAGAPSISPSFSQILGAPDGVRLRADGPAPARTFAEIELGGGDLAPGTYRLTLRVEASGTLPLQLRIATPAGPVGDAIAAPGAATSLLATIHHPGGPLRLTATATSDAASSAWISGATLGAER